MASSRKAAAPTTALSDRRVEELMRNLVVSDREKMAQTDSAFHELRKKFPFTTHNTVLCPTLYSGFVLSYVWLNVVDSLLLKRQRTHLVGFG